MDQGNPPKWTVVPGDILLLAGNSKSRSLNLGYQSLARGYSCPFTHVALVFSPFRVIHAMPGYGVEIRAWRELRDKYNIQESSVARLQDLDGHTREKLLARASYYIGQRYKLMALYNPSEVFENQQGIVCSQFVAQVFHDVGIDIAAIGERYCLPIDIHLHTVVNEKWMRSPLSNFSFDSISPNNGGGFSDHMETLFEVDGYAAESVKNNYLVSKFSESMEASLESMVVAVDKGIITFEDIKSHVDLTADALSYNQLRSAWMRHFATVKHPSSFMHEDESDRMKQLFVRTCESIDEAANAAVYEIEGLIGLQKRFSDKLQEVCNGGGGDNSGHVFFEIRGEMLLKVGVIDQLLSWRESFTFEDDLDLRDTLESACYGNEDDVVVATEYLKKIINFTHARSLWNGVRCEVKAMLEYIDLAINEG